MHDERSVWFKGSVESFELTSLSKDLLTSEECLQVWSNGGKRIALILLSLTGVLCNNTDKPDFQYLAKIFLLHAILLDYLPLKLRTAPPVNDENTENNERIQLFLRNFYAYCTKVYISDILLEATKNFQDLNNNLYDLVDTRLIASLIQFQYEDVLYFNVLPIEIQKQFDSCWNLLTRFCECNGLNSLDINRDEKFRKEFSIEFYRKSSLEFSKEANLLPFKYEFFEECLGDMHLELPENSNIKIDSGYYGLIGNVFNDDSTHWHSTKPIDVSEKPYHDKHANSRKRKGYQKFVSFMERYAASLNGTQGYYTQNIIVDKSSSSSKSVKKGTTGAKLAREKIEKDKLEKSLEESEQYLEDLLKDISKDKNIKNQLNSLNVKLEKGDKIKHPFTRFRGQFKKLELLVKLWAEHCKSSSVKSDFAIPVDILHQVFFIVQNFPKQLDEKMKGKLVEVLDRLGLNDCKNFLEKIDTVSNGKSFKFHLPRSSIDLSIGMSDARFQMLYAGHLMDRNTNSVDDSRVPKFKPGKLKKKICVLKKYIYIYIHIYFYLKKKYFIRWLAG